MNVKLKHLRALKTVGKGTTGGTVLVRLADGTVERRLWTDDGFERRVYSFHRVPIETLTYAICFFNEDYLIQPDRPQHGTWMRHGLTFVCDARRHLVCWPYSTINLHAMARALDIPRHWFHKNHYDLPQARVQELVRDCNLVMSPKLIVKIIRGSIGAIAPDVATSWQTLAASLNAPVVAIS